MSVPIQPLADYVVAEKIELKSQPNKTASGFYIPGKTNEAPNLVKVVAVGAGVKVVKVGDQVVYKGFSETTLKLEGTDYVLVREEDIIATVKG